MCENKNKKIEDHACCIIASRETREKSLGTHTLPLLSPASARKCQTEKMKNPSFASIFHPGLYVLMVESCL